MSGLKTTLPVAVSDTTLDILRDDLVLPTANVTGVLGLWEFNHSARPAAAGFASGLVVPNVAFKESAATLAMAGYTVYPPNANSTQITAAQTAVDATFTTDASYVANTTGKFERTTKGALHGIMSQVGMTAVDQGAYLNMPSAIKSYIIANSAHAYFFSVWDSITRVASPDPSSIASIINNASGASNRLFNIRTNSISGTDLGSAISHALGSLGAGYYEQAQSAWLGTVPNLAATVAGAFWGSTSKAGAAQNSGSPFTRHPSHILYRMYLEDLTLTGRTFAQVSALDQAAYALAFGTGGRYNGDTNTAPSTLP